MGPTVLFVCTGNLCRSPMAAGFFRQRLEEEGLDGQFTVRSAGTWAAEGEPASPNTLHAMADYGIDLGAHQAHLLTPHDVQEADVVVVMEQDHADAILRQIPEAQAKVHLLTELAGAEGDVLDPYGMDIHSYRETAGEIRYLIGQAFHRILTLARAHAGQ